MTDQAVPAEGSGAPASQPAPLTSQQISELISQGVQAAFDSRIPGLMSTYDKKLGPIAQQLEEMRRTNMSEDELESDNSRIRAELAEARRQAAAAKAAISNPAGYAAYEQIIGYQTPEEQIAFLQQILSQAGQQTPAEDGAEEPATGTPQGTPAIDRNNPRREEAFGGFQSDEAAENFLNQFDRWPGETPQ